MPRTNTADRDFFNLYEKMNRSEALRLGPALAVLLAATPAISRMQLAF